MADIDEQVYLDAAGAVAELDPWYRNEAALKALLAYDQFRAAVASAYRAGQAATPDGPRRWALPPADVIARRFHETYERLAPDFGYRTREASAKPWAEVPEQNRALMIRTVMEVRDWLTDATPAADGQDGRDG